MLDAGGSNPDHRTTTLGSSQRANTSDHTTGWARWVPPPYSLRTTVVSPVERSVTAPAHQPSPSPLMVRRYGRLGDQAKSRVLGLPVALGNRDTSPSHSPAPSR